MENPLLASDFTKNLVGYSRQHCKQLLLENGIENIAFAHWLAIPSQQLLLIFRHQRCVAIDGYFAA